MYPFINLAALSVTFVMWSRRLASFIAELFDNYMQQDAHEFLNYLLNTVADLLQGRTHRTYRSTHVDHVVLIYFCSHFQDLNKSTL